MFVITAKKPQESKRAIAHTENRAVQFYMHPLPFKMPQFENEEGRSFLAVHDGPWYCESQPEAVELAKRLAADNLGFTFCVAELMYDYMCQPQPVSGAKYTKYGVIPIVEE